MSDLKTIIDETLLRKRASGIFDAAGCACSVIEHMALEDPEQWATIRDGLALEAITAIVQRRITRAMSAPDPRQGLLALPGYERVPQLIEFEGGVAEVTQVTLDQYRESETELARPASRATATRG